MRPQAWSAWTRAAGLTALVIGAVALVGATCDGAEEASGGTPIPVAVTQLAMPSPAPTQIPAPTPRPTDTPAPTATPTAEPTPTAAPTPTPTPTPTPAPAPAPTPTPTPAPPSLASFDPARLAAAIGRPVPIRMQVNLPDPTAGAETLVLAEIDPLNRIWRQVLTITFGEESVDIESIGLEDVFYLRIMASNGDEPPWLRGSLGPGEEVPFGSPEGVSFLNDLPEEVDDVEAVDLVSCGDSGGRVCFLVLDKDNPASRVHVDAETYYPVRIETTGDDGSALSVTIEWDADIAIVIPEDPTEATSEQIAQATIGFLSTVFPPNEMAMPECPSEPRSAADFDPLCLRSVLNNMPAVRLRAEFPVAVPESAFRLVAELPAVEPADESDLPSGFIPTSRQRLSFAVGARSIELEIIKADRVIEASRERTTRQGQGETVATSVLSEPYLYLRSQDSDGTAVPWMAAPAGPVWLGVPEVEEFSWRLSDLHIEATAVDLVDCGAGRVCFVVQPEPPEYLLYLDAQTYEPVRWEISTAEGVPLVVDIEWNAEVDITLPENPFEAEREAIEAACVQLLGRFEDAVGVADPDVGVWNGRHIASFCRGPVTR